MYCLQWLLPLLLIPRPANLFLLHNHSMFMTLYLASFFLERRPCTICTIVFIAAVILICYSGIGNCLFLMECSTQQKESRGFRAKRTIPRSPAEEQMIDLPLPRYQDHSDMRGTTNIFYVDNYFARVLFYFLVVSLCFSKLQYETEWYQQMVVSTRHLGSGFPSVFTLVLISIVSVEQNCSFRVTFTDLPKKIPRSLSFLKLLHNCLLFAFASVIQSTSMRVKLRQIVGSAWRSFVRFGSSTNKFCNTNELYNVKNPLDWSEVNNTLILPGDFKMYFGQKLSSEL